MRFLRIMVFEESSFLTVSQLLSEGRTVVKCSREWNQNGRGVVFDPGPVAMSTTFSVDGAVYCNISFYVSGLFGMWLCKRYSKNNFLCASWNSSLGLWLSLTVQSKWWTSIQSQNIVS